jgi:UDP-glucose 4-epimerase
MAIFVTGGAGYIGSHTVIELIKSGYDVVVADNFSNSKREAIKRVKELAGKDFAFYEIDVCSEKVLSKIFSIHDIECVIHFAGLKAVAESIKKPLEYYKNNLNSTIALSNTMIKYGVNNIIFSSSATVYRPDNKMPLTEESQTGGCTNPYGWTKYMCEQILTDTASGVDGFTAVLLRYFNPIGAHESGRIGEDPQDIPNNLMPFIAQTAVGRRELLEVFGDDYDTADGTCVRDYLHVVDLAEGHVAAVKYVTQNSGVSIFNLGTGNGISVLELVSAFEDATGVSIPRKITQRRAGDIATCYAATDKARDLLGWETKKTLKEACADTWHWQKNNPTGYGGL